MKAGAGAETLVLAPGRASRQRRQALIGLGLFLPSAALVLAFTIFPVAYNVWLGFFAKHSLRATSTWVGLDNYVQILADMVMAVVERGKDPRVAAKEASDKIVRDIIGKAK